MTLEELQKHDGKFVQVQLNGNEALGELVYENGIPKLVWPAPEADEPWENVSAIPLTEDDAATMSLNGTVLFSLIKLTTEGGKRRLPS